MATLPQIRNKVSVSSNNKNKSLKDLLTPMGPGVEVLSVEAIKSPLHNTKVVIKLNGVKASHAFNEDDVTDKAPLRTIYYNRVDIADVLPPSISAPLSDIDAVIEELNSKHQCDFTTDDIESGDYGIRAKETSLGYYNSGKVTEVQGAPMFKISVGIRTLTNWYDEYAQVEGGGYMDDYRYLHYAEIFINGDEFKTNGFGLYGNPGVGGQLTSPTPLQHAAEIVDVINNADMGLKASIKLQQPWCVIDYDSINPQEGAVIEIENMTGESIDLSINLVKHGTPLMEIDEGYNTSDGSVIISTFEEFVVLPATLILGKGIYSDGCAYGCVGKDTLEFKISEWEDSPWRSLGRELNGLSINGSSSESLNYFRRNEETGGFFWPFHGLENLAWVFLAEGSRDAPDLTIYDDPTALMLINRIPNPYSITPRVPANWGDVAIFAKLGPVSNKTPLDKVFLLDDPYDEQYSSWYSFNITIGDETISGEVSQFFDEYMRLTGSDYITSLTLFEIIAVFMSQHPGYRNILKVDRFFTPAHHWPMWHFQNLTDEDLYVHISINFDDGQPTGQRFPPFILKPKGTMGETYNIDKPKSYIDTLDVDNPINTDVRTVTWRGVTSNIRDTPMLSETFTSKLEHDLWNYNSVLKAGSIVVDMDDEYCLINRGPYRETFIFNIGEEDEYTVTLDPNNVPDVLYRIPK